MECKIKNLFFDFNGTILDDLGLSYAILCELVEKAGINKISLDGYRQNFTFPVRKYYENCGFDFTKITFEQINDYFLEQYNARWRTETKIFDDCIEVLKKFKEKGYKLYILTACEKGLLTETLDYFGITDLFDGLIASDNNAAEGKVSYGSKYIKEHNIDPSESILLGDTIYDKDTADALGMRCTLFALGHNDPIFLKNRAEVQYSYRNFYDYIEAVNNEEESNKQEKTRD